MNTKTFAQQSRQILLKGVAGKLRYWGFDEKGRVTEMPDAISGGYVFRGEVFDDPTLMERWESLRRAVITQGREQVLEEAAYTWFNRLMAIRILAKNGYDPAQLEYAEGGQRLPLILQRARRGTHPFLNETETNRLRRLITDFSRETEAFAILLIGYCHAHPLLQSVFGRIDDYTELLLPDNILAEEGFLHLLNTTDAISDADYREVELIGWLYQFYISEKKDEVFKSFKKNKKAEAKDIPAATQIFTPNWIVKYMVENTVGKIWLDLHPDSPLRERMKYLVESPPAPESEALSPPGMSDEAKAKSDGGRGVDQPKAQGELFPVENPDTETPQTAKPLISEIAQLKLLDPACGSGHILVEGFDLLYQMYLEEYYTPEEAVQSILQHNLFGLDIDRRAVQLARFAVLLKAARYYRGALSAVASAKADPTKDTAILLPNIYSMPTPRDFSRQEILDFLGREGAPYEEKLTAALRLMQQAQNLGSIMQFDLPAAAVDHIARRWAHFQTAPDLSFHELALWPALADYIPVLLILCRRYEAVVANPPYMGKKNMNTALRYYLTNCYPFSKTDLFAVFIEQMINLTKVKAKMSCITMESWMFLPSYEKLRHDLLEKCSIVSLAHFGWHIIGIAFGTVAIVIENIKSNILGEYSYLTIEDINELTNTPFRFPNKDNGRFAKIYQSHFTEIPGSPIAYWASKKFVSIFSLPPFDSFAVTKQGLATGDNNRFLRFWAEVSSKEINYGISSYQESKGKETKWVPYSKGGEARKWFGNNDLLVYWRDGGNEIRYFRDEKGNEKSRFRGYEYYFREALTWSLTSSTSFAVRLRPSGFVFDINGMSAFPFDNGNRAYLLAFLNSKVAIEILEIINPTMAFQKGDIAKLPIILTENKQIDVYSKGNVHISKKDWDAQETSWNFQHSPLLNGRPTLEAAYRAWAAEAQEAFFRLHANEEALNRIFIEIYGLEEELSPEVALKDVTILQEELVRDEGKGMRDGGIGDREEWVRAYRSYLEAKATNPSALITEYLQLPIRRDVVMQQFISYAVGIFMGRYRLDRPGLGIAHPDASPEEVAAYKVIRGKGLGSSAQMAVINYLCDEYKEFSRSQGLAKIDGPGRSGLSGDRRTAKGGAIRSDQSDPAGGGVDSVKHSGGTQPGDQGIHSFSEDSEGLAGGVGDSVRTSDEAKLSGAGDFSFSSGTHDRDQQDDQWVKAQARSLIPNPSALTPFQIDEDAILPLMGSAGEFPDDAVERFKSFLDLLWGPGRRTENLNFLQACLDMDLEKYLVKHFWADHCRRYKKRPIYWLFASPKGAFQALVYMHRMNAFTVEKIRANYLLPHLRHLRSKIAQLEAQSGSLSSQESRALDRLRKDLLECEAYDLQLKDVADRQIVFDLDDGVAVNYALFGAVVAAIK